MRAYKPFSEDEITPFTNETWGASHMFRFNNFFCNFPWSDSLSVYRTGHLKNNNAAVRKYAKLLGRDLGEEPVHVTYIEFYKDIDDVIEECGLKMEEICEVIIKWKTNGNEETSEKIFRTLAPIYKGMRNKGYATYDLWT